MKIKSTILAFIVLVNIIGCSKKDIVVVNNLTLSTSVDPYANIKIAFGTNIDPH